MCVGEAPGQDEVTKGAPFVGAAGHVLTRIIEIAGGDRGKYSISNVAKRAPDGGYDNKAFRSTFYETTQEEIKSEKVTKRCKHCNRTLKQHTSKRPKVACKEFEPARVIKCKKGKKKTGPTQELLDYYALLKTEIEQVNPNVIVAIGNEALKALCGINMDSKDEKKSGITKYRGSVLPCTLVPSKKVVPMVHPAMMIRGGWKWFYVSVHDWVFKVLPNAEYPEIRRDESVVSERRVARRLVEVREFLGTIADGPDRWTIDLEVRKDSQEIACVGVGIARVEGGITYIRALTIPVNTTSGPYWTAPELEEVWGLLFAAAECNPHFIGQNVLFDIDYLSGVGRGAFPAKVWLDLKTAHATLHPELPHDLAFLCSWYLPDVAYYKDDIREWSWRTADQDMWTRNLEDVVNHLRLSFALEDELQRCGKVALYKEHVRSMFPHALEMQLTGLHVQDSTHKLLRGVLNDELARVHPVLVAAVGREINVNSDKQVMDYLYGELKLPVQKHPKTHKPTVDEDALMVLRGKFPDLGALKLIMQERHLRKGQENYLDFVAQEGEAE